MSLASLRNRLSSRERAVLGVGAAVSAALLVAAFAGIPLERKRAQLERELPGMRAAVVALQRDADEVRRLRAMPAVSAASREPLAALAATSLSAPPGARLTPVDNRHLRLSGEDVGFARLLEWIASAQAAQGLHVESARIEALAAPGRVRAELTLARP